MYPSIRGMMESPFHSRLILKVKNAENFSSYSGDFQMFLYIFQEVDVVPSCCHVKTLPSILYLLKQKFIRCLCFLAAFIGVGLEMKV